MAVKLKEIHRSSLMVGLLSGFFLLGLTQCFGGYAKEGAVRSYLNGVVQTFGGGSFRIGSLPPSWRQERIGYHALLFRDQPTQSSITVEAFCGSAFDDGSLPRLTQDLVRGMDRFQVKHQKKSQMAGRDFLLTEGHGQQDGAPVFLGMGVLRLHGCVFDFVYVSTPEKEARTFQDFQRLMEGFEYLKGPSVLNNS